MPLLGQPKRRARHRGDVDLDLNGRDKSFFQVCLEVSFGMDKHVDDDLLAVKFIDNPRLPYKGLPILVVAQGAKFLNMSAHQRIGCDVLDSVLELLIDFGPKQVAELFSDVIPDFKKICFGTIEDDCLARHSVASNSLKNASAV